MKTRSQRSWTWKRVLLSIALMWAIAIPWALATEDAPAAAAELEPAAIMVLANPSPAGALPDPSDQGAVAEYCKDKTPKPNKFESKKMTELTFGDWAEKLAPILLLLLAIIIVLGRLPRLDLGHTSAFRRRRVLNWLPLGLTYAFLYMGRYNLNVAKTALGVELDFTKTDFAIVFGVGTVVYGFSFIINGPLTDKLGGRFAILLAAVGAAIANLAMGFVVIAGDKDSFIPIMTVLYAVNMYFQSFGAVAIVKVNAPWFHVRERGVFGAIFGILISLGIYFAFDWSQIIVDFFPDTKQLVFFVPGILLLIFFGIVYFVVRNTPGEAGQRDFDPGDADSGDDGPRLSVVEVFKKMLTNKVIVTIAFIEFCSGYLRQAIMQWYKPYANSIADPDPIIGWVYQNWGLLLCCAGILGGVFAGVISDRVFGSRRGPVAGLLYGLMLVGAIIGAAIVTTPAIGMLVVVMSMCIIGVHGMLSGTASMDFGGRKNTGIAVGIIDGFVYLGTGVMSLVYGFILPTGDPILVADGSCTRADLDPSNWVVWPLAMIPLALVGLVLSLRIWNAKPKGAAGH